MIRQDPPTVVRGPAVRNMRTIANNDYLTIRPPEGEEWFIETIVYGGDMILSFTDGTITVSRAQTSNAPNSLDKCGYTVTHDWYITIQNKSGGNAEFGYSGYRLQV